MTWARPAAAVALAAGVLLLTASPAAAHADLDESTPAAEAHVAQADQVRLQFDEPVQLVGTGLQVRDLDGHLVAAQPRSVLRSSFEVPLPERLAKGVYTVGWVIRSRDGDVSAGSYQFTLTSGDSSSGSSRWVLGAWVLLAVALVALIVAGRRRSRTLAVAAGLVLVGSAVLLVSRLGESSASSDVDVTAERTATGLATVTVTLPDDDPVDEMDVRVVLDAAELAVHVPVVSAGDGVYRAKDVQLPTGDWRAAVSVLRGDRQQLLDDTFTIAGR